eukprot:CAMPEP_0118639214 /NCGR_PEP_ID=MMETSP0785-20121206/4103_1 /TAXON_ID=91992 /ORGANISM="Bolidomonas pacifica, Strain CCMP 1866" /LENGTH=103 /DNA_ID=CAMNT_0006530525 /DNA_START=1 /DNA_END=312 /DNA_ORIENTATION=+
MINVVKKFGGVYYGPKAENDEGNAKLSKWYDPVVGEDVFVDSGRYSVAYDEVLKGLVMRPVFWRYYGEGQGVRRSKWTVDWGREGLQPFDRQSEDVLEEVRIG